MNRHLPVLYAFSLVLLVFAGAMLLPVAVSAWLADGAERAYDEAVILAAASALVLWWASRRRRRDLRVRDGFLLVSLVWLLLPAFAAVPFWLYFPAMSFTDAYFEAVSGLTTTGATVIEGLDGLPYSINLWRAELQWLGGMCIIVLAVAILPLLGVGGRQAFGAEAPGPIKETRLTPRMVHTARGLWAVYAILAAFCALGYVWAGMDWGDAVIHTFTTLSLGGFSSHDASFAHFDSARVEWVAILFMTLGGMNFATHFAATRRGGLDSYRADSEIRWYLIVMYASVLGVALYLWQAQAYPDFATALRFAAFNVVSIATTTGYASTDFLLWPYFAPLWMLFLASFACCAGSTGGGLKMMRAVILFRQVKREVIRTVHPNAVRTVKLAGAPLPNRTVFAVLAFVFAFMVIIVSGTLLLVLSGLDVVTAFSAAVACITSTGPGLGEVGPAFNYKSLGDFQTWLLSALMLLGRLEIFTLLVVFSPAFWRK